MAMGMLGSKRGRRAARRLALPAIREALMDGRVWTGLAIVVKPSDQASHFDIDEDIGVLVHVELTPHGTPMMARLGGLGSAGTAGGAWRIPGVGSEVAVIVPGGTVEGDAIIVGVVSDEVPSELDGDTFVVKSPKVVIVADDGQKVTIKSASGTAAAVPTMADFNALRTYVRKQFAVSGGTPHIHTVVGGATTTLIEGTTAGVDTVPAPAFTTVLETE